MSYIPLEVPEPRDVYTKVGYYREMPVYKSNRVDLAEIAYIDHSTVVVNSKVYHVLEKDDNLIRLMNIICERDLDKPMSEKEELLMEYIRAVLMFD